MTDHENELDRLRRKHAAMRDTFHTLLEKASDHTVFNDEDQVPECTCCGVELHQDGTGHRENCLALAILQESKCLSDTAADYISKAVSDEMAKQILASAAMTEELRQKVFILRVALEACESPRRDCRNSDACLCVRCGAIRQTKLDGQPLDYISKESVKPLVEAAVANHKWHREYDDYGGYPESDLCELNCKAIAVAKSLGIPTEKEGA